MQLYFLLQLESITYLTHFLSEGFQCFVLMSSYGVRELLRLQNSITGRLPI
ncbi:hypothetical protein HanRHA438_Chr02g0084051 [Helianthus annuus]|nr:hypothetical protein HanRHA438_Chr02g0084051 [Helianthus annuus]